MNKLIKYIFILLFSIITVLLILVDTTIGYNYININKPDNFTILYILLTIFFIYLYLKMNKKNKLEKTININEKLIIKTMFFLLLIIQLVMLKNIYFESGWDVALLRVTANNYANTNIFENNIYYSQYPYFDIYPNNIFLTTIFGLILKFAYTINLTNPNKLLVLISIILVDLSGIIMIKTLKNFTSNKKIILLSSVIFALFIGLSPWFLIPYSDTYSIIFPISILYNYTKKDKTKYNYLLIGLLSLIGTFIKPTCIIILISITILELIKFISNKKKEFKIYFKKLSPLLLGILLAIILNSSTQFIINYKPNKEKQFTFYHYLMMGINEKTNGAYSEEDVMNSIYQKNYQERINYNKTIFIQRLKSFSIPDLLNFYLRKILLNYNDGTLAWGREGEFYYQIENNNSKTSELLQNVFYNHGNYYNIFSSIMQIIWITIIISTLVGSILKKEDSKTNTLYLTIIGITLFILIFEARARYLYLYIPFFIITASLGLESINEKIKIYRA